MDEKILKVNENIKLIQPLKGHTFGTDAFLLYAFMNSSKNALELGTGTGIISLLCCNSNKFLHIDALEVQSEMTDIASKNVTINNLNDKINIINSDLRYFNGKYDVVFSNPPYIKIDSGVHNPDISKNISRREIFGTIDDFCNCASRCLNYGGSFYVVWRPERLCDLIFSMRNHKIEPKRLVLVYPTPKSKSCLVLVEGKFGGKCGSLFVAPPLILNDLNGETEDYHYIYERGEFPELFKKP